MFLILLVPMAGQADDFSRRHRIDLYTHADTYGAIHHTGPLSLPRGRGPSPCFPYGCGGIEGPFKNPEARKDSDKPACYYNAQGTLFYEREGKYCPYKYSDYQQDQNKLRVERRRKEWLYQKNLERVERRRQEWLRRQRLQE